MSKAILPKSQEVSDELRDEILCGRFRDGERLPSERDLAARFGTSRGSVREALKKLEQLGIASIQPGGARVVPVSQCTLDVLGPLLGIGDRPNAELVDQALEVGSLLVGFAVRRSMATNPETVTARAREITAEMIAAPAEHIRAVRGPPRLLRLFAQASDHLVLQLIMNGLRGQVVERMQAAGFPPRHDPEALRAISKKLDQALEATNSEMVANTMIELINLMRQSARQHLAHIESTSVQEATRS
jgi:DNA-binding FadR family transcriptional regulator